jgi:hypothetical protein
VYNTSGVGGELVMQYHLDELPALFIVDPITGAKLWQKSGFVSPDTLIEELVPFLDMGEQACRPAVVAVPNVGTVACWPKQRQESKPAACVAQIS